MEDVSTTVIGKKIHQGKNVPKSRPTTNCNICEKESIIQNSNRNGLICFEIQILDWTAHLNLMVDYNTEFTMMGTSTIIFLILSGGTRI